MPTYKWNATTAANLATTELNNLANNTRVAGQILDNTITRALFANLELAVQFTVAPNADSLIQLYLLPSIDGTNYADGSPTIAPGVESFTTNFVLKNTLNLQRIPAQRIPLDPFRYLPLIVNTSGQAFPASGSTLRIASFSYES
ncbi:MAG: hypothetical protein AB1861_08490 [Cyanobacteriota bacterium]